MAFKGRRSKGDKPTDAYDLMGVRAPGYGQPKGPGFVLSNRTK
jgi:hypothetical protein